MDKYRTRRNVVIEAAHGMSSQSSSIMLQWCVDLALVQSLSRSANVYHQWWQYQVEEESFPLISEKSERKLVSKNIPQDIPTGMVEISTPLFPECNYIRRV